MGWGAGAPGGGRRAGGGAAAAAVAGRKRRGCSGSQRGVEMVISVPRMDRGLERSPHGGGEIRSGGKIANSWGGEDYYMQRQAG